MNAIMTQTYTGYNPYQIHNNFSSNNLNQNDKEQKESNEQIEAINADAEESKIQDELSNEEIAAIYFNRQAVQLTKDLIAIHTNTYSAEDETTLRDLNQLQRQVNRYQDNENVGLENILNSNNEAITQEAVSAYYKYQANELVENKIDIYASVQSENNSSDITYKDLSDISSQNNRDEFIQNYELDTEKLYA